MHELQISPPPTVLFCLAQLQNWIQPLNVSRPSNHHLKLAAAAAAAAAAPARSSEGKKSKKLLQLVLFFQTALKDFLNAQLIPVL